MQSLQKYRPRLSSQLEHDSSNTSTIGSLNFPTSVASIKKMARGNARLQTDEAKVCTGVAVATYPWLV